MTVLTHANRELFRRPQEEHFASFEALCSDAVNQRARCHEVAARDIDLLFGEDGIHFGEETVLPTHYSLAQLSSAAKVPMALLERLRPATRMTALNEAFERSRRFRLGLVDGNRLRAVTSDRYERVWDAELYETVDRWLLPSGFIPAVPTMNTDEFGTNVLGNTKPALFRSDRDSYAFFFSEESKGAEFGNLKKGVTVNGISVMGVYFPLLRAKVSLFRWLQDNQAERLGGNTLLIGDFNTGRNDLDAEGKPFFHEDEFRQLEQVGWTDLWRREHGDRREYTWHSRVGNGFRIDHAFGTAGLMPMVQSVRYEHEPRLAGVSDHSALVVELRAR